MVLVCLFVGLPTFVSIKVVTGLWGADDYRIERRSMGRLGMRSFPALHFAPIHFLSRCFFFFFLFLSNSFALSVSKLIRRGARNRLILTGYSEL